MRRDIDILRIVQLMKARVSVMMLTVMYIPINCSLMEAMRERYDDPAYPNIHCYIEAFPPIDADSLEPPVHCASSGKWGGYVMRYAAYFLTIPLGLMPPIVRRQLHPSPA